LGHDEVFSRDVVLKNIELTTSANQLKYVLDPNEPEHVESVFAFHKRVEGETAFGVPDDRVFFQPYDRGTLVNIYSRIVTFNPNQEYDRDLAALTKLVMERSGSRFRVVPQLHKYIAFR